MPRKKKEVPSYPGGPLPAFDYAGARQENLLGRMITSARHQAGLSQQALSQRLRLHGVESRVPAISRWEPMPCTRWKAPLTGRMPLRIPDFCTPSSSPWPTFPPPPVPANI